MIEQELPRYRGGRTLLAAVLVELLLVPPTIIIFNTAAQPEAVLDVVIPILCFGLFIPAGMWVAKGTSAPIANGVIAGIWGILLYVAMTLVLNGAVADFDLESSVRPAYVLAHGMKVVGGVIGGIIVARRTGASA